MVFHVIFIPLVNHSKNPPSNHSLKKQGPQVVGDLRRVSVMNAQQKCRCSIGSGGSRAPLEFYPLHLFLFLFLGTPTHG